MHCSSADAFYSDNSAVVFQVLFILAGTSLVTVIRRSAGSFVFPLLNTLTTSFRFIQRSAGSFVISSADHSNDIVLPYVYLATGFIGCDWYYSFQQILLAEPLGSLAFKMVQVRQLMEEQQVELESADGWRCVYPRPTLFRVIVVLF
ncbi:hypothetical protein F511_31943 [Dorcoceras hygrometricum]|uniref:Uncharacterized protein n=1 Tax=Dorcoceras hygrometricum TaxID=472368 RepID=A0A2Z7AIE2_9LAMI|nr:hypothetical protein F511_31943 [Dorcoceras hygrometricum]